MKRVLFLFATLLLSLILFGCANDEKSNVEQLYVTGIYVSTYNTAIESTSSDAKIYYLSENDERNFKLTIEFNKELSEDNNQYLFYMQTGSQIPIIPTDEKSDIKFDIYKISKNMLEISYAQDEGTSAYTTPMLFTGLYIPKGFKAKDGTTLEKTFEAYFTGYNPHTLLSGTNSYNGSPETIVIAEFGDKWVSMYGKKRDVGFVNNESASLYSDTGVIDMLTISDNVEILSEEGDYYKVNVYRPLPLSDSNHHSKFILEGDIDIYDSKYLKKITGKIEKKYITTIDLTKDYACARVFSSNIQNYYELSDVFLELSTYPLGTYTTMIYDGLGKDSTYSLPEEFETIEYKPLNEIVLNEDFFDAMEILTYNSFADSFGDAWVSYVFTNEKGENYSLPIDDAQNHYLIYVYPEERTFVNECLDLHNNYISDHWKEISSSQKYESEKNQFNIFLDGKRKLSEIWFEWSEIDKTVNRNIYIELIKKHFSNQNGITDTLIDNYFNSEEDLLFCLGNFIDNELWPRDTILKFNKMVEDFITK